MLFKGLLDKKFEDLQVIFDDLYKLGFANQTHSSDMLLVCENAHITGKDNAGKSDPNKFYWQIGTTLDAHAETTHYNFIREYVQDLNEMPIEDYMKLLIYDPNRNQEIDDLKNHEAITIQIEMLIYLKIWESDVFMTRLHQFVGISHGHSFDWHFKIDAVYKKGSTGKTRSGIIQSIIDNPDESNKSLIGTLSKCYNTQLRNAIAHSQYAILGDNIMLTNAHKETDMHGVSFADWRELFHETIAFHRLYFTFIDKINDYYFEKAKRVRYKCEIRIHARLPVDKTLLKVLQTRDYYKDWMAQD